MSYVINSGKAKATRKIWTMGVGSSASTIEAYSLLGSRSSLTQSIKPKVFDFVLDGVTFSEAEGNEDKHRIFVSQNFCVMSIGCGEKVA